MRTPEWLALCTIPVLLVGCGGGRDQALVAQDPTVTVRYDVGGEDKALHNAKEYCDDHYDRGAALVSRSIQNGVYVATYQCVKH